MARAPLNALQDFVAVARVQNLTRAAERQHITVSALSHQMRALEQRVGCPLFVRGSRGLTLTAEGRMLLENVAPHIEAIEQALRPLCGRRSNVLNLSATPSMGSSWLLPRLPRFVKRHPEMELNLDSSIELVDFADGRFDAALRYGPGQWPGVIAEPLFEEWLTPVASPSLLKGRKPRLDQLGEWPLLCPEDPWLEWFATFGGKPPKRYAASFSDSETRQRAAVEGIGIALGRTTMVKPLIEAGMLVALFPQVLKARYGHYLVYPQRSREHNGFIAFREWLLEEAAQVTHPLPKVVAGTAKPPSIKARPRREALPA
ncbi:MAG: LysR substrate-binding domain-containing protein [Rhodanobacteraceae bacterium]